MAKTKLGNIRTAVFALAAALYGCSAIRSVVAPPGSGSIPYRPPVRSTIKALGLALQMYALDWDDSFPPAATTADAKAFLMPYTKSTTSWTSPVPGGAILFNTSLAGVRLKDIPEPKDTILLYESVAQPDGTRWVAYVDGSTDAPKPARWSKVSSSLHSTFPHPMRALPNHPK